LKEAQNENSPLIQTSSDQRIKVTLLYVGPMKRKLLDYVYVITYLVEDLGPEDEYERHVAAEHAPPNRVSRYDLFGAGMEVKDGSHQTGRAPRRQHLHLQGGARLRRFQGPTIPA
jgi:hypothetical protein